MEHRDVNRILTVFQKLQLVMLNFKRQHKRFKFAKKKSKTKLSGYTP